MFVKICGITRPDDLKVAVDCGADAIGFIAYPKSPRYVEPAKVGKLLSCMDSSVRKVGVFVDAELKDIQEYVDAGINTVQLHGNESPIFSSDMGSFAETWKAFNPYVKSDVDKYQDYIVDYFLIDAFTKCDVPGGTGKTADWELALYAKKVLASPLILAGGLTPYNIEEAIEKVDPFGVDLSSGLEISPGVKDHELVKAFMKKIIR